MNILIISSSDGIFLTMARCLGINGHNVYGFNIWTTEGYAYQSRFCKASSFYPVIDKSQERTNHALEKINSYCAKYKIDLIIPSGLFGTYFLSKNKSFFSLPLCFPIPEPKQIEQLHNKWFFFLLLKELNLPTPNTELLQNADASFKNRKYPLIVKPISCGNSDGVQRCDSTNDLASHLQANGDMNATLLVQDYYEGFDAIFGFLADHGKIVAWTLHRKTEFFLEFFPDHRLLNMANKIIEHTNYHGVGNFDVRYDDSRNSFTFLECNPRFWASCGASKYFGVDFFELGITMARQKKLDNELNNEVSKTQFIPYPSTGRFAKGLLARKYNFSSTKFSDLAWQSLLDPWPLLMKRLSFKKTIPDADDTFMIEHFNETLM